MIRTLRGAIQKQNDTLLAVVQKQNKTLRAAMKDTLQEGIVQ